MRLLNSLLLCLINRTILLNEKIDFAILEYSNWESQNFEFSSQKTHWTWVYLTKCTSCLKNMNFLIFFQTNNDQYLCNWDLLIHKNNVDLWWRILFSYKLFLNPYSKIRIYPDRNVSISRESGTDTKTSFIESCVSFAFWW